MGSDVPLFMAPVNYPTGVPGESGAEAVAVADINGDGIPDLIVASCIGDGALTCGADGMVGILLGKGDGTFQPVASYDAGKYGATSVAVADLNGDGKPDLVIANPCTVQTTCPSEGSVTIMLGNGDGTFQPGKAYDSGGQNTGAVAVTDLNRNGKLDVVVTNSSSATVGVLRGNGDGTLQPAVVYASGGHLPGAIATADVNGDGKQDIVVTNAYGFNYLDPGTVGVLLGNGDGTFQSAVSYDAGGKDSDSVAIVDVNHDGRPDIVVANLCTEKNQANCGGTYPGEVGILLGNGDGTFQPVKSYSSGGLFAVSIAVADLNGDGNPDAVVANQNSSTVGVLLGNGDGTFQPAETFKAGGHPTTSVVADLNRDGRPDIISLVYSPAAAILLNRTGAQPTANTLASNLNPSIYGQKVTFTATVAPTGTIPPTGKVLFQREYAGKTSTLGSALLNSTGVATFARSNLGAGPNSVTAVYAGDLNNLGSTSQVVNQTITQATSSATVTSSPNPSSVNQAVTFAARITSPTVTPSGSVTFGAGKTILGTVALKGGKATLTTTSLGVGSTVVTVTYGGNSNIEGSSAAITQVVH